MSVDTIKVTIRGNAPLLMHSGRLADPLDPAAKAMKEVSSKRKKTEADHEKMKHLEWLGGLYTMGDNIVIPTECIEACIRDGAKKSKRGKDSLSAVWCDEAASLKWEGPTDLDDMFADENFVDRRRVKVGQAAVMRTRPRFNTWTATFTLCFNPDAANKADVVRWLEDAGKMVGLGDFRPKFGRFDVESAK